MTQVAYDDRRTITHWQVTRRHVGRLPGDLPVRDPGTIVIWNLGHTAVGQPGRSSRTLSGP